MRWFIEEDGKKETIAVYCTIARVLGVRARVCVCICVYVYVCMYMCVCGVNFCLVCFFLYMYLFIGWLVGLLYLLLLTRLWIANGFYIYCRFVHALESAIENDYGSPARVHQKYVVLFIIII
ncbi:hypothetical protein J3Q64DRAFT_1154952 [Phycomyces blakesleeanus]|uniref:Uncharacterized protein n=1 Tax=Phycomyces blakesleeanus TaxID=4837 RepID=A0ABR3AWP6_PHYBL